MSEKGEVLIRVVGTLRYLLILGENSACRDLLILGENSGVYLYSGSLMV